MIEGYPRSGNTFAETAFLLAQNNPDIRIATHLHLPFQITRAVELDKPCLILIRKPVDAIASLLVYAEGKYPTRQAIKEYIDFYEVVRVHRDRLIVATFEDVLNDFGRVIERLNDRFGCTFKLFEPTEENKNACFNLIEERAMDKYGESATQAMRSAKPTEERNKHKQAMMDRLTETRYASDLEQARSIYRTLCKPA